ncbi:hypothetical protein N9B95_03625 [Candidatus Pelagibacter sp.]|nr:hypothetical protein [Candidatus Pelagibacter sp.]
MYSKLEYRPDIDTLRAISVFAVIIYHAGIYASKKIQNIFNLSNIILIAPSYGENDKIFQ